MLAVKLVAFSRRAAESGANDLAFDTSSSSENSEAASEPDVENLESEPSGEDSDNGYDTQCGRQSSISRTCRLLSQR